jgi:hypothetical protein
MFQNILNSVTSSLAGTIGTGASNNEDEDRVTSSSTFPPPNLACHLVGYAKTQDYHEFQINCTFGWRKWTVHRRYNQFHQFHSNHVDALLSHPVNVKSAVYMQSTEVPMLPPKKICGNREEEFVENRKSNLEAYLGQVMSNSILCQSKPFREFVTDADRARTQRLYNEHIPLLQAGARFKKIGAVFERNIRMRLTNDCCALEYWTPVDNHHGKGDDVRLLRIHTITNVSPTNQGLIITAEREGELDTSMNSKSKFIRTAWLNALQELMELMHLARLDDNALREIEREEKATLLRDVSNNRQKQKRAMKRKSLADKYKR